MEPVDLTESGTSSVRADLRGDASSERSLSELLSQVTTDLGNLVRKEIELAKVETKEQVGQAGKAGGMLGAGAVGGLLALIFLSGALAWGLAEIMPTGFAFLIVGVLWAVVAAVAIMAGRKRLKQVRPVPEQTIETLKEDVAWAKAQRS